MGKCLVTKLNGTVNNNSILRLGEMRFKINKVDVPTEGTQLLGLFVNTPSKVEIIGDGYFTDKNLQENKGKSLSIDSTTNGIFVSSTSDVEVALLGKYAITRINAYYNNQPNGTVYAKNKFFDIDDLKYSTALITLNLPSAQVSGDIANLKNLTALATLNLYGTQVSGDVVNLKNLTALTNLNLANTRVSGDIANLKNLTALTTLNLYGEYTSLTGNIDELSALSKCTEMSFKYSKLTGDLASLPSVCRFASFQNNKGSVFTWSTRSSSAKIIAIEGNATLNNIDKMLQDQAQCQVGFSSGDAIWYKTIQVAGNRTSVSDDAVATLQQKGYTISIAKA
jgi:hypothetical protein